LKIPDIAGAVGAQHEGAGPGRRTEQRFDACHRCQQLLLLRLAERFQQRRHLGLRATVQRCEGAPPGRADRQPHLPRIGAGAGGLDQPAFLETAQQPAQVAGVEVQRLGQLGGGGVLAVRQLPQQARFGQRKAAVQQAFVQHADAARVEAVEGAQRGDAFVGGGHCSNPDDCAIVKYIVACSNYMMDGVRRLSPTLRPCPLPRRR